ncbi:ACT domain-containing protein [Frankineae bacterium MT45]|nr:ACT domain-containing protein [Frankineae bacterium MT45]
MSYLLRVVLPDRPGALGAVATALGSVGADILSVDVIERSPGFAVDDLVLDLAPGRLADSLITAARTIEGVRVESIRPYASVMDPHRELELLDRLAAGGEDALEVLADGVARIFRAGWVLVLDSPDESGKSAVLAHSAAAPEISTLAVPWWPAQPARVLDLDDEWVPSDWTNLGTELAIAPLGDRALLVGRPGLPWLPGEIIRLNHLAGIANSVAPV